MKGGGWVRGWRITRLLIEYQLDSNSVDQESKLKKKTTGKMCTRM